MPVPLEWVIGTLTIWHYAIWAGFMAINVWPRPRPEGALPLPMRLWAGAVFPPVLYAMVSLIVGQIVGDRFPWSMLWPAGMCLGALFSSIFLGVLLAAIWNTRGRQVQAIVMLVVAVPLSTMFFGLFFTCAWWLFPRVIDFGLIPYPDLPWGVHLYRGP